MWGQDHLSSDEVMLLAQTAKQAAYAESLAGWCAQKNAKSSAIYVGALQAWRQKNHWAALAAGPVKTELSPGEYDGLKTEALNGFNAHGFRTVFLCAQIGKALAQVEHDPSIAHGAELARIASQYSGQGTTQTADAPAAPVQAEDGLMAAAQSRRIRPQGPSPAAPATAGTAPVTTPAAPPSQTTSQTAPQTAVQTPAQTAAPVAPAAQGSVNIGDVSMAVGPGWTVTKNTADAAILQKQVKEGVMLISLGFQPMQGTLAQSFPDTVRRNFPGERMELKYIRDGLKTRGGLPVMTVRDGGRLNLPNCPRARVRAVGIAAPDGRMFLAMLLMRSDWESAMSKTDDEFEAMIATLRFRSQPESALWDYRHPTGKGGQSGLYWSNSLQNMINPLGGMDLKAIRHYIVLLPNGQAYNDLPKNGHVLDVNPEAGCEKRPTRCGTYSIEGGQIKFRWMGEYGMMEENAAPWSPKGFKTKGEDYRLITPVHNLRVSGRFTSTFAMVGNMVSQSTSVVSETYITLTADGRYQKSGFSAASFDNENAAGTFGGRKGVQTGTYSMDNYTLTLNPAGGVPELYSLVLEDPSPNADALFIDDSAFLKKK